LSSVATVEYVSPSSERAITVDAPPSGPTPSRTR
jgi:hypothetical protein